jgi:hypothetical protein
MALEDSLDYDEMSRQLLMRRSFMIVFLLVLLVIVFYMAINQASADKEACYRMLNRQINETNIDTLLRNFTIK